MGGFFEDRVWRCGESDYISDEIGLANRTHTDARLGAIADAGFNGIWLHGKLRTLVPTRLFEGYVEGVEGRLRSLKRLCERADRHGLGVWVYFTEPLGLKATHEFWRDHPELAGHETTVTQDVARKALCSSTAAVQEYLAEGFGRLAREAALRGLFLITTSEHVNHCWGHVLSNPSTYSDPESFWAKECRCERCRERSPMAVIAQIVGTVRDSVKTQRPDMRVVAWDWSWNMHCRPPYKAIVDRLPGDVAVMGDFERGGTVRRAGAQRCVEEYSLSFPGPSGRFRREAKMTAASGRDQFVKLQMNTTHELATVPNLPMLVSLYRKWSYLRDVNARGLMGTWNIACWTDTVNVFGFKTFCRGLGKPDEQRWLESVAREYFGKGADVAGVARAWRGFHRAMGSYPWSGNRFVYFSPVNYGLVYPLKMRFEGKEMGWCHIVHEWGDRLEDSLGTLSLDDAVGLLEKLSRQWRNACEGYEAALADCAERARGRKELGVAMTAAACFRSLYHIYRWYQLRKGKRSVRLGEDERAIVADELANLEGVLRWVKADRRLGYHQEAQAYLFTVDGIEGKMAALRELAGQGK